MTAAKAAIAGNVIDLGAVRSGDLNESVLFEALRSAIDEPLAGGGDGFGRAVLEARSILYLADNAGEIAFDRLLIERLPEGRVTVAVRGAPILNDATRNDAAAVGLHEIAGIVDNGSDAPGTLLEDCRPEFRRVFEAADLVIAKGQGNYETLSDEPGNIYFLFKAKCPVIAEHAGVPLGSHVLLRPDAGFEARQGGHNAGN